MLVNLAQAISQLKNGQVVAIPTETVYGLAADATNDAALRNIYAIKERPLDNPLIVHIAQSNQVKDWAAEFSPLARKLAHAFWPGPLTLVLPAKESVSAIVRANQPTVALRVPNHPLALQLLLQSGLALAAPSANKFTQLSPTSPLHVQAGLGESVAVLDGGTCKVGLESTIVSVEGDDWRLLRLGMITQAEIQGVAGKAASLNAVKTPPKVPGQHLLHYSPSTPVQLCQSRKALLVAANNEQTSCAALVIGSIAANNLPAHCLYEQLAVTPDLAAEQFYAALHRLDQLKVTKLLIEMPPNEEKWLAITDKLNRAAYKG